MTSILRLTRKDGLEIIDISKPKAANQIMKEAGLNNGCLFGGIVIDEDGAGYVFDGCHNLTEIPEKYEVRLNEGQIVKAGDMRKIDGEWCGFDEIVGWHPISERKAASSSVEVFAERLANARESRGITQARLARLSGLSASAISVLEKGDREPSLDTALKLASALGVTIDYLIGTGVDNKVDIFKLQEKLRCIGDVINE